ncbi:branched-chain amino acid transporter AzlD [Nocardiopsis gilva YIM 90087]|uniref:Branched-chain amino acid transporter AzlD n=1 Tax=Nocardiopsis gilva YIM 90087 TaxID=1235441 RepID=A0A223S5R4_9ACTN|nr:AzlD domain-containing protein [Nocardiopsis gilva]ASU83437.1 branched-chain amino acid transporter AzlD [Nocardiopsis gilva YIM 90087]
MTVWIAILATSAGCYLLKFAGLAAPRRLLDHPVVRRFAVTVPIALLAALIAIQSADNADGPGLALDAARLSGLGAAVVALVLRAPFLVVVIAAAATTAGLRALGIS